MHRWHLREEESYTRCVAQLGGARNVDRALAPLIDALRLNPRGFPHAGYGEVRLARTHIVIVGREIIPALSIRFVVEPPNSVSLLHIEMSMPEEMEVTDAWPWC